MQLSDEAADGRASATGRKPLSNDRPAPALATPRLLAAAQSTIWLALLMHGGWALIFAPLALLAAVFGGRYPAAGSLLLAPPVAWLTLSWAPALAHTSTAADWGTWAILVGPASLATGTFAVAALRRFARVAPSDRA